MNIIKVSVGEGRHIVGVACDSCGKEVISEKYDIMPGWVYKKRETLCPDCVVICRVCGDEYSVDYAKDFFMNGLCEDCFEYE